MSAGAVAIVIGRFAAIASALVAVIGGGGFVEYTRTATVVARDQMVRARRDSAALGVRAVGVEFAVLSAELSAAIASRVAASIHVVILPVVPARGVVALSALGVALVAALFVHVVEARVGVLLFAAARVAVIVEPAPETLRAQTQHARGSTAR